MEEPVTANSESTRFSSQTKIFILFSLSKCLPEKSTKIFYTFLKKPA